jgi:hypothetical protein
VADRENEVVYQITRQKGGDIRAAMNARDHAKRILADPEQVFDLYRPGFLMLDLFPKNADRFELRYADCFVGL